MYNTVDLKNDSKFRVHEKKYIFPVKRDACSTEDEWSWNGSSSTRGAREGRRVIRWFLILWLYNNFENYV